MHEKLILFDVDGTLIKSGDPTHFGAYSYAMKQVMGIEATIEVKFTAGNTDMNTLIRFLELHGFARHEVEPKLGELFAAMKSYYTQHAPTNMESHVIAGVRPLLSQLHDRQVMLGLISGGVGDLVWEKMKRADLRPFFALGAFGDQAEQRAELVQIALHEAELVAGIKFGELNTLIVGDTPRDIACARDNNLQVVAVATGPYTVKELKAHKPDFLLNDFLDTEHFLQIVAKIHN